MTESPQKNDYRAVLQQALVSLDQMEAKLRAAEQAQHAPIAITGMGFRFPGGASDARSFWNLLLSGKDAITEVPPDRWNVDQFYDPDPDAVGKMYTRWGGFLSQADQFDPHFFGISPREAVSMDPQQRLLLETTWEALENAGAASVKLHGSRTGVFVGMVGSDYASLKMISGGINDVDAYFGAGVSRSIAAGRIAYTLGLHGPAVSVDTACSSSLVAAHQACQSLRLKECDLAVAGGVNMILEPSGSISTSRSRMMSFDGRCKTFDAAADGYVRSEGCAMVVLKRLSDALADGDPILAVILGTAVNQDGRSNGLTAPNGKAQEAVIHAALEDARRTPGDISYVETHGTGTTLGDPIEVRALGAVFRDGHTRENPLMIGSVKTNVGHLEAAAGIVGLVKVVLALQNKTIPPHLHLNELNPLVPWNELPIIVPTQATEWNMPEGKQRIAGLSSFGFSGTNIHMVITEAPEPAVKEAKYERAAHLFTISARTEPALKELAARLENQFRLNPNANLADVAYSLNTGRSHFSSRLALTASSLAQVQEKLSAWMREGEAAGVAVGAVEGSQPEAAFLFTGQGAQYPGMARQLFDTQPSFHKTMLQCDEILRSQLERPLLSVIYPESAADADLIHQTAYTQPALFAVEYSLAKLWQDWGVEPAVVMGHSIGEYPAACLAGVFSLEDGLKLVAARGRLMQSLPPGGVMAAVFTDEERACAAAAPYASEVSIAAVNGPGAVVISGTQSAVSMITAALLKEGIKSQPLTVSHAFHSPLMDSILDEFEAVARSVQYHLPQIGVISNVTGKLVTDDSLSNAAYWREHARRTVRFADGVRAIHAEGYRFFLETGPNPTLLGMARRCEPSNPNAVWLPSLRSGRGDWEQMLDSLAQLYVHGQGVDWDHFERDYRAQRTRLELPTYPFQRQHYWLDFEPVSSSLETKTSHPLLGSRLATAAPVFQKTLTTTNPPYLADHRIHGMTILPAAAYFEIAFAAAKSALEGEAFSLEDVSIHEALPLATNANRVAQIVLNPDASGASFQYFSRKGDEDPNNWRLHAGGKVRAQATAETPAQISLDELRARIAEPMAVGTYYDHLAAVGADYGPAFHGIQEIWRTDGEALGLVSLPEPALDGGNYSIHPSLLDACFQLLGAAVPGASDLDSPENAIIYVPVGIQRMDLYGMVDGPLYCHVQLHPSKQTGASTLTGDLSLFEQGGRVVVTVRGLLLQQIDQQTLRRAVQVNVDPWLYELNWVEQPRAVAQPWQGPGAWLLLAGDDPFAEEVANRLTGKGDICHLVYSGDGFARKGLNQWVVNPLHPDDFSQLLAEIKSGSPSPLRGVIHLWSVQDSFHDEMNLSVLHSVEARICAGLLHSVQALAAQKDALPRLWLVTRGAQAASDSTTVNAAATSLWGMGNVIALEQPGLNCTRIDLDPAGGDVEVLVQEIWSPDSEDQIALRGARRLVARLAHARGKAAAQAVELVIQERGTLDNLLLRPVTRQRPGPGEVEVAVRSTGLNFRDVLNVLAMYPGDAGALGSECAGVITATGEGVGDLKIGDEVIALASHSFGSYVTVSADLVVRKPVGLSFEEAATIPIAFLTADYALNRLAKMQPGDRVLIHAAAGGVGMAAVQLARRAGAEIFGTAGSEEKRALLKSLGVQHVFNSRSLDFAEEILAATGGEGVDIVLNSLAGDFIPKSLSVLKETGRFVEIGKTDVWNADRVRQIKSGAAYFVLYLGEILEKDPQRIRGMLLDLLADFERGVLRPLPRQVFPLEQAVDAFRFMAQAKHTGKIVITQQHEISPDISIREDATYLISGGLGGLGLVTARWLVDRGARHLVLLGRSRPSPQTQEALDAMQAEGAEIFVAQADVSQPDDLQTVFSHIARQMPPLRGLIHAAGVLDDGILLEQTWPRFITVMAPKIDGAWNLHKLAQSMPLDFFILFSAGASLMGSPGQANYAAANSFLDGLAHYRRASGLPALSINWGAWAEVGMASRLGGQAHRRWAAQGMEQIKPADGVRAMERLIERRLVQAAVLPINWQKINRQEPEEVRPLLRLLAKREAGGPSSDQPSAGRVSFVDQVKQAPPEEQLKLIARRVTEEVNKVLGLDASHTPNPKQGFTDIGLDSLMAVELSNRLQKELGRSLPSTLTFEYPTIEALTNYLATEVLVIAAPPASQDGGQVVDKQTQAILKEVEGIPEESLEDAILKELKDAGY